MRQLLAVIAALSLLTLSACNTIEHRSEKLPKKRLPEVAVNEHGPQLAWSSARGFGATKGDSLLHQPLSKIETITSVIVPHSALLHLAVTKNSVITADNQGMLRSRDRATGKLLWEKRTKKHITGGPTVASGIILIGTKGQGVLAYDASNGKPLWHTPLSAEVLAAPKVNKGNVYVHAMDGSISALDLKDGKILWRHSLAIPQIVLRHGSSPSFTGSHVIVGFSNGRLISLNQTDGSLGWEHELSLPKGRSDIQRMSDISADTLVEQGIIYAVSYQGKLAALKADTGTPIWEREMSSYAGFAKSKNTLFLSEAKGRMFAIDSRTGKTMWEQTALQGRRLSKPEIFGNHVVVGDEDGYLHWISIQDGSFLSRTRLDKSGIEAPPMVIDNTLYVLGKSGKVAAFNLK